jgi:hypothetical protein
MESALKAFEMLVVAWFAEIPQIRGPIIDVDFGSTLLVF